jgi:hypothetical protein
VGGWLKLPTQAADGRAVCFCGAATGLNDMDAHVYAAHMEPSSMKSSRAPSPIRIAARQLIEIASTIEPAQDGPIAPQISCQRCARWNVAVKLPTN